MMPTSGIENYKYNARIKLQNNKYLQIIPAETIMHMEEINLHSQTS
jgi:hypothetical protein